MPEKDLHKFELLFKEYFTPLCGFATGYVKDMDEAKGIVHEVFIGVWNKFDTVDLEQNFKSYLYTSVRNRCLNFIRDHKKQVSFSSINEDILSEENNSLEASELENEINYAINSLPDKCRQVFELSRLEGLKYAEIAVKMKISVKTVEAQVTKALKILRNHLVEYLSITIFLWIQ